MPVGAIVVEFDVFEHDVAHQLLGNDGLAMHHFHFQGVEEAFSTGIVVAVALGTHAIQQLVFQQQVLITGRAVLAATVRVYYSIAGHTATP